MGKWENHPDYPLVNLQVAGWNITIFHTKYIDSIRVPFPASYPGCLCHPWWELLQWDRCRRSYLPSKTLFLWNRRYLQNLSSFKHFVKNNQILSWCTWKNTWFLMLLKATSSLETTRFASSHSLHGAAIHWGALVQDSRPTAKTLYTNKSLIFIKTPKPKRGWRNEPPNLHKLSGFLMGLFHTFHLFSIVFIIFPQVLLQPRGLDRPPARQRQRAVATEPARAVSSAWGLPSIKQ